MSENDTTSSRSLAFLISIARTATAATDTEMKNRLRNPSGAVDSRLNAAPLFLTRVKLKKP